MIAWYIPIFLTGEQARAHTVAQQVKDTIEPETKPNATLLKAVRANDPAAVRKAFADGASPNARIVHKKTDAGSVPFLSFISAFSQQGATDRQKAIAIFQEFVRQGVDSHLTDDEGRNITYWALDFEDIDLLRLVLDRGADVQTVQTGRMTGGNIVNTVLMMTGRGNREKMLPFLALVLERGANPNLYDARGMTPLHMAALSGFPEQVDLLLKQGADPTLSTRPASGPGIHLEGTTLELARRGGDAETIRLLAAARKDMTPVEAAGIGDAVSLRKHLETGGDPNLKDKQEMTLLQLAAASGNADSVRLLLEHHAQVNGLGAQGMTALHHAAIRGNTEAALLLLNAGADPNLVSAARFPQTPLSLAVQAAQPDMVALLLDHGANVNTPANKDILAVSVQNAGQVPGRVIGQPFGRRPAIEEVLKRQDRIYDLLVAKVNVPKNGGAALCMAVDRGQFGIARDLIAHGANINAVGREGYSVLMLAIQTIGMSRDQTFFKQRQEGGDATDRQGMAFLRFLLARKPDLTYINPQANPQATKDERERTALDIAHFWKVKDVESLLKNAGGKP